MPKFKEPDVEV